LELVFGFSKYIEISEKNQIKHNTHQPELEPTNMLQKNNKKNMQRKTNLWQIIISKEEY